MCHTQQCCCTQKKQLRTWLIEKFQSSIELRYTEHREQGTKLNPQVALLFWHWTLLPQQCLATDWAILHFKSSGWVGRRIIICLLSMIIVIPRYFEVKMVTRFNVPRDAKSIFHLYWLLESQLAFRDLCFSWVMSHCLSAALLSFRKAAGSAALYTSICFSCSNIS